MTTSFLPRIEILNAKQQRLTQLELRAAIYGIDTPPEVANEIADLKTEIAAVAPNSVAESHAILYDFMVTINARFDRLYWFMALMGIVIILAVKL
jgi:hypothetical protein